MIKRKPLISIENVVSMVVFLVLVGIYSCVVAIPHGFSGQQSIRQQIINISASISVFIPVAIYLTILFDGILSMIIWGIIREKVYLKGRLEERQEWENWNARRCKAEAEGTKFDEPPPNTENGSAKDNSAHKN